MAKDQPTQRFFELKKAYRDLQDIHDENIRLHKVELETYREQFRVYMEDKRAAETEFFNKKYILPDHLNEVAKIVDESNHHSNLNNEYSYYKLTLLQ
jgi:pterin-4a-carbinolamine dehydratase